MKLKQNTDLLNGLFQAALSKKTPTSTKKKTHKETTLNTILPPTKPQSSSSSFSFVVSLSQLPASTEKQQVMGKTTAYVGTHWVLRQLQLSSLAGAALQAVLHLFLITNTHGTAQGNGVFCYHFTRTHCRSAASGRNCSLPKLNLTVLKFSLQQLQ